MDGNLLKEFFLSYYLDFTTMLVDFSAQFSLRLLKFCCSLIFSEILLRFGFSASGVCSQFWVLLQKTKGSYNMVIG